MGPIRRRSTISMRHSRLSAQTACSECSRWVFSVLTLRHFTYSHWSTLSTHTGYSEYSQVGASLAVCASEHGRGHAAMRACICRMHTRKCRCARMKNVGLHYTWHAADVRHCPARAMPHDARSLHGRRTVLQRELRSLRAARSHASRLGGPRARRLNGCTCK